MARYFTQVIGDEGNPPDVSIEACRGLAPMTFHASENVLRAQDKVVTQSRRVLWRTGVNGDTEWRVPNTDPGLGGNSHPVDDSTLTVAYGKFEVTPGCTVWASCLHLPSGSVNWENGSTYGDGGVQGIIHIVTTWYSATGTSETYTYAMPLDGSTLQYGKENTNDAGMQKSYRLATPIEMHPPVELNTASVANLWSRYKTVDVEIRHVGSPRIVDFVIYERPWKITREADDADSEWVSHLVGAGKVDGPSPQLTYPVQEREGTAADEDQRLGSKQALNVCEAQRLYLAPALFHWSNFAESIETVTATVFTSVNVTNTSGAYVNFMNTSQSGYDATEPGWSMGCGGYARNWLQNNPQAMGTANAEAVAPVLIRVYGSCDVADCQLRFQTSADSWVDYNMTFGGANGWHAFWGWLKVGLNPEDHVVGQLLVQVPSGADIDIFSVCAQVLYHAPADSP